MSKGGEKQRGLSTKNRKSRGGIANKSPKGKDTPGLLSLCLCLKCDSPVGETEAAIECHSCKEWCHKKCTEVTEIEYEVLGKSKEHIQWLCTGCCDTDKNDPQKTRLEAKLDLILKMMQTMDLRLQQLEAKDPMESIDKILEEKVEKKVAEMFEEQLEKEKRKLNIIMVNLPESKAESAEERKKEDLIEAKKIVQKVTDEKIAEEVTNPIRLGKVNIGRDKRPRLVRLSIKTEEGKRQVMKNIHKVNQGVRKAEDKVYINHDATAKEREMFKGLMTEMKERKDKGETDLVIRGGKIVKRTRQDFDERNTDRGQENH